MCLLVTKITPLVPLVLYHWGLVLQQTGVIERDFTSPCTRKHDGLNECVAVVLMVRPALVYGCCVGGGTLLSLRLLYWWWDLPGVCVPCDGDGTLQSVRSLCWLWDLAEFEALVLVVGPAQVCGPCDGQTFPGVWPLRWSDLPGCDALVLVVGPCRVCGPCVGGGTLQSVRSLCRW